MFKILDTFIRELKVSIILNLLVRALVPYLTAMLILTVIKY